MTFNRYNIQHIDLAVGTSLSFTGTDAPAHYFVFWYSTIPLGHSFLSNSEIISESKFLEACWMAIAPALKHYSTQDIGQPVEKISLALIKDRCSSILGNKPFDNLPSNVDVSVVICTKDRPQFLRKCLSAIALQSSKPREIIVVDNASATNDTKIVASEFENVVYVRENRPGLDIARNTGARTATSSIVAFTDDDTTPHFLWTYHIAETFNDKNVQAMTGLVLAGSLETEAEVIFEKFWPFNRGYIKKTYDGDFFESTLPIGPPVWEIGAGANMAFRKEIFSHVGFFDERLDVGAAGCSGDSEMWYRILANGFNIQYNPLAVVSHYHRSTLESLKRQLHAYMKGFTVAILIQYHRFGHTGNLQHLFKVIPLYYLSLLRKGFPKYGFQYRTLFSEIRGLFAGLVYYLRHKNIS